MTWFKVDDQLHAHPKIAELETGRHFAEAVALWTLAGSWCADQLTDGLVPAAQLRRLVPFDARKAAAELVRVRLWEQEGDGYRFRSWHEYQPSREDVLAQRAANTERQQRSRAKRTVTDTVSHSDRHAVTDGVTKPVSQRDRRRDRRSDTSVSHSTPTRPDPDPDPEPPAGVLPARVARDSAPPLPSQADPMARFERSFAQPGDAERTVEELVSRTRVAAGGGPYAATTPRQRDPLVLLARWVAQVGSAGLTQLEAALTGFWRDKSTSAPLDWLAEDPGRFLAAAAPPKPPRPRGALAPATSHEKFAEDAARRGVPEGESYAVEL